LRTLVISLLGAAAGLLLAGAASAHAAPKAICAKQPSPPRCFIFRCVEPGVCRKGKRVVQGCRRYVCTSSNRTGPVQGVRERPQFRDRRRQAPVNRTAPPDRITVPRAPEIQPRTGVNSPYYNPRLNPPDRLVPQTAPRNIQRPGPALPRTPR
jgi:hypothetical protein